MLVCLEFHNIVSALRLVAISEYGRGVGMDFSGLIGYCGWQIQPPAFLFFQKS